ncbi:MAG: SCP2 sterol-binding domain-containing protein [Actinobacteria bacterium]|nr:SCP2 sterol-binding domain-containing protein [Actinomycetota bacterium]MCG2820150.1 SCP2 sterol-binding domain-containing protein [Actinomycetes bacterium]MBU4219201.1 SCP2 sterol-binding domain-containing protein [Actinomycetota bacterium]MBU4359044.1 SCP2 sterol-binding domain-containing protein [Actinomycetota bacterium]MBU4392945.1 SCP2 sterol-binding domain-containing protein [Actinomycetota bacterium]
MGVFKDADQLYELLGGLFDELTSDENIAEKFAKSALIIHFNYTDPDAEIWLDASQQDPENLVVITGPAEGITAEVEMSMKADIAHQFWLGNVNLMVALTRKQIVAKGPIPKIMKLLPVLKPAYVVYRQMLEDKGLGDMITEK